MCRGKPEEVMAVVEYGVDSLPWTGGSNWPCTFSGNVGDKMADLWANRELTGGRKAG